jgi:hypothetical protein
MKTRVKTHPCHTAFKPATGGAPQNATTRMLLLVTKLHKNGVLSAEAKGRVKACRLTTPPTFVSKCCWRLTPSPQDQVLRGTITEAELQRQYGSAAAVCPGFWRFLPPQKLTTESFLDRRRCTRATLALSPRSTPSRLQPRSPKVHTHTHTQRPHVYNTRTHVAPNPIVI